MIMKALSGISKASAMSAGAAVVAVGVGGYVLVTQGGSDAPLEAAAIQDQGVLADKVDPSAESLLAQPIRPQIDLVRVEANQQTMIVGRAVPNAIIDLVIGGEVVGQVSAEADGNFVFFDALPEVLVPTELLLRDNEGLESADTVLILPTSATGDDAQEPPTVVIASQDTVDVIMPDGEATGSEPFALASIAYSDEGAVILAGKGEEGKAVQVYLDNEPISTAEVDSGRWSFEIDGIEAGLYTLRVDQLGLDGDVDARVESPFERVDSSKLAGSVTIQPGFTLWRLAQERFGEGARYIQIYEANKALIRDPDLIYPGQVFELPE